RAAKAAVSPRRQRRISSASGWPIDSFRDRAACSTHEPGGSTNRFSVFVLRFAPARLWRGRRGGGEWARNVKRKLKRRFSPTWESAGAGRAGDSEEAGGSGFDTSPGGGLVENRGVQRLSAGGDGRRGPATAPGPRRGPGA